MLDGLRNVLNDIFFWLLLIPFYFWGMVNYKSLSNHDTHPDSFKRVIIWLKTDSFALLYLQFLGSLIDWVGGWIGDRNKLGCAYIQNSESKKINHILPRLWSFTSESYEKCLRLALLYPIVSFFIMWILGGNAQIGTINWLITDGDFESQGQHWITLALIFAIAIFSYFANSISVLSLSFWFSLSFALSHSDKSIAHLIVMLIEGKTNFSDYVRNMFNIDLLFGAIIFFPAFIVLPRIDKIKEEMKSKGRIKLFWMYYSIILFLLGYFSLIIADEQIYMILLLFYLLLPLVNAPFDWISLGVTRMLLQEIRIGRHSSKIALGWTLTDLLLAVVFLFMITAMLVGVTSLGNAFAGKTLVDIGGILQQVEENPSSVDHWWIYFMLLSTLLPTLLHFALAGGAATLWLPRKWRLQLADGLERDVHKTFLAWAYLTFMPVIGFVLVPGALLYFLWWLLNMHGGWLGMRLLDWAEMLAHFANPSMQ